MNATRRPPRHVLLSLCGFVLLTSGAAHAQDLDACIAASESALVARKAGKLIDSRAQLAICSAMSCPEVVRTTCQQRLTEVNAAIPSIVFVARDGAGRDVTGASLVIDGKAYAERLDGRAIVLDPGEHEFRFDAPGQDPVIAKFVMREGERDRRENILIGPPPPPAPPSAQPPLAAQPVAPAADAASGKPGGADGSGQRTLGLVVGGVGVAGLGVGRLFGLIASSQWSSSQRACSSTSCTNHDQAVSDKSSASSSALVATISFIAGGAALAAGGVIYLTAPARAPNASAIQVGPTALPGGGGMLVHGTF